jgi:hypothetical protein
MCLSWVGERPMLARYFRMPFASSSQPVSTIVRASPSSNR